MESGKKIQSLYTPLQTCVTLDLFQLFPFFCRLRFTLISNIMYFIYNTLVCDSSQATVKRRSSCHAPFCMCCAKRDSTKPHLSHSLLKVLVQMEMHEMNSMNSMNSMFRLAKKFVFFSEWRKFCYRCQRTYFMLFFMLQSILRIKCNRSIAFAIIILHLSCRFTFFCKCTNCFNVFLFKVLSGSVLCNRI